MRYTKSLVILFLLGLSFNIYAQLNTNESPVSFGLKSGLRESSRNTVQTVITPILDMVKIEAEDKENEKYDMPPRFGYTHKVNYDLNNSGTWYTLPNGDKLWQLNVICPNALSVNFCYDKFWLPEGGKLFVYSKDRKHSIGAFTSRNNKGTRENLRGFATSPLPGDNVMLEYYQPKDAKQDAVIKIDMIVHGYRLVDSDGTGFGSSNSCMVNVNCSEGIYWQKEKKAIALVIYTWNGGAWYFSGSLINSTDLNREPFFLTADHCIRRVQKDAINDPYLDYSVFRWDYEVAGCENESIEPSYYTTSGATILANNVLSDFALLRLTEDPKNLSGYTPYYLGWDRSGQSGQPGVCIHHPRGDVKKIATAAFQPQTDYVLDRPGYYYWSTSWKSTPNGQGLTASGSSGAPLLNAAHKIIGQLYGGLCSCVFPNAYSYFGKYDLSWIGNNNDTIQRRLNCWLDPQGTWGQTLGGLLVMPSYTTINTSLQFSENICIPNGVQVTIQSNVELIDDCRIVVESGGCLLIDGGVLNADVILKPGATLRIINNGTLDTDGDFEPQVGAIVEIIYGKII